MERKKLITYIVLAVVAFFLFAGIQIYHESPDLFHATTPYMLTVFALIAFAYAPRWQYGVIAVATFLIEWIGVISGFPFGTYYYTDRLGFALLGVPILIGINWAWISIGAKQIVYLARIKNKWLQAVGVGLIIMLFDILLEPVAIGLEWWVWPNGVGLANYLSWFAIGFVASFWIKEEHKLVFPAMVVMQMLFFLGLILVGM